MSGTIHKLDLDRRASGQDAAYAEMLERAHALVPKLRERASVTEEMRRLPPETERELHEAGLFRILQPKRVGGSEFDYVALVDFADVIALGRCIGGLEPRQPCEPSLDARHVRQACAGPDLE